MHVAMIMDAERLMREHLMLNRLAIGLLDEGVRLTRIVPDALDDETIGMGEERISLAPRIEVPMRVLPWLHKSRTARLIEEMGKNQPDVVYCVGRGAWSIGLDIARVLEKPAALGVWSARLLRRVPRGRAAKHVGGYLASTNAIAEALRTRVDSDLVAVVPMGVAIPSRQRDVFADAESSIGIAVIGSGRDLPAYRAVLGGLKHIITDVPQAHIFLELRGPHAHDIWRIAKQLDMLSHVSSIREASQHRPLVTRCDLMLVPERYGEPSSLLLEAMAYGMPIIASDDAFLDMLVPDESAIIVRNSSVEEWSKQIRRLTNDPAMAKQLGRAARDIVSREHASTVQSKRLIETLNRIVDGGVYRFDDREVRRQATR